MTDRYITIYLRDHLAMGRAGIDFAIRIANSNDHNVIGARLDEFISELDEEIDAVLRTMELLGIEPSQLKMAGAWLAEKIGRFKLNGEVTGYSPLSRVLELEFLMAAVQARKGLWMTMNDARRVYPELDELPIDRFVRRTDRQLEELTDMHKKAARTMLKNGQQRDERPGRRG